MPTITDRSRRHLLVGSGWSVLGSSGSAVLAAGAADVGIGWLRVSFAFGLSLLSAVYAFGSHFNPALTLGLAEVGKFPLTEIAPQLADAGAWGHCGGGDHGCADRNFLHHFLDRCHRPPSDKAPVDFAGIAIGLCLTPIHLVSIPVTNASVDPARGIGAALFADGPLALEQFWLVWPAPFVLAILGAPIWQGLDQ